MGASGVDKSYYDGKRTERDNWNVCSYVLLHTEPIIVEDFYLNPDWIAHPFVQTETHLTDTQIFLSLTETTMYSGPNTYLTLRLKKYHQNKNFL